MSPESILPTVLNIEGMIHPLPWLSGAPEWGTYSKEYLVNWVATPDSKATWTNATWLKYKFPDVIPNLVDKVHFEEGSDVKRFY